MRIVHMADLHLGYRQFQRLTPSGRNQREDDVSRTFFEAVAQIVALSPDLIVVAGDVFHKPRPSNAVLREAADGFRLLARAAPTVVVAGNHDTNRQLAEGQVLDLLRLVGCDVITSSSARAQRLDVQCVPESAATVDAILKLEPDGVLVCHGEASVLPFHSDKAIPPAAFRADQWQYVALGHFHERYDLWPNGGYSGSLDYVSSDIWGEARRGLPKGFLVYDTDTGKREVRHTQPRPVVDFPVIEAHDWRALKITEALLAVAEYGNAPDGAIVRQRLSCERTELRSIDHRAIRKATARLLTFQITRLPTPRDGTVLPPKGFASWEAWEAWCRDEASPPSEETDVAALAESLRDPDLETKVNALYGWNPPRDKDVTFAQRLEARGIALTLTSRRLCLIIAPFLLSPPQWIGP